MRATRACLAMCWILTAAAASGVNGQTPPQDAEVLAQRFRPYYKFSKETDAPQELHRPCSWQWYFSRSRLTVEGNVVLRPEDLQADPRRVLEWSDVRALTHSSPDTRRMADAVSLEPVSASAYQGEPWDSVIHGGAGLYAHVTTIDARFVNIEYWTLYAFNRLTGIFQVSNHVGDITGIHVVYDRLLDRLVRVTYGMHGGGIEAFDLLSAVVEPSVLFGVDPLGNVVRAEADRYSIFDSGQHQNGPFLIHDDSEPVVYLVQDPQTGRGEHPALFIEWGAHEPWPNPTGFWLAAPRHRGDGVSFLPAQVHLLGSADDPFLFFGGRFGDPVGLQRHRVWRSEPGIAVADSFRNDRDPYRNLGPLTWPPTIREGRTTERKEVESDVTDDEQVPRRPQRMNEPSR